MGKYNRQTTTRKLQKLTDDLVVGAVAPEVKAKISNLIEKQPNEVPVVKQATVKPEEVKKEMPQPKVEPALRHVAQGFAPEQKVVEPDLGKTPAEIAKLNVYQKLALARKVIAGLEIKKSGANDTEGFNYFELADYLPMLNNLNDRLGLMTNFSMTNEMGTLKIFNTDKPKEIAEFSIPTADLQMSADGKQTEGIQILGGKTTYLRRYLMQIAYEISVKDSVDNRPKAPAKPIEELDARDIQTINEASDVESLNLICQNIRQRKGFKQHQALLKHYTEVKEKLKP